MAVRGLREIKANLTLAQKILGVGVKQGMTQAGEFVKIESQDDVPVATGALRDSAYVRIEGSGTDTHAFVGYAAPYALPVHENLEKKHPQGRAKFLERAARQNRAKILDIIAQKARLP